MKPGWRPATEEYAGLVRAHLQPESRLLDLGCGRGGLVEQLGHPLRQIVGLDPDLASLREHRLKLPRALALSRRLPLAAQSLDLVFASWLLEHLARPEEDLREIGRVLKPGGHFIFITPNRRHPLATMNRLVGRLGRLQGNIVAYLYGRAPDDTFPAYYRANSETDLRRLAQSSGLCVTHLQTIPDPTYLAFTPALFRLACRLENSLSPQRYIHLVGILTK